MKTESMKRERESDVQSVILVASIRCMVDDIICKQERITDPEFWCDSEGISYSYREW